MRFWSPRRRRGWKCLVNNPLTAASAAGGATLETNGWWTYTTDHALALRLGRIFEDRRYALYLPTIQKDGHPVDQATVDAFKEKARQLGLVNVSCARGVWILSTTGEAQVEVIWIFWAEDCEQHGKLPALAQEILVATNQDSVASETPQGGLEFLGAQPTEAAAVVAGEEVAA